MKEEHEYTSSLEEFLMYKSDNELFEWFQQNTIRYDEPSLLKRIRELEILE